MDIREILEHLPHRYPMLLVDRVLECEPGKRILAIKNVSVNEPFFSGHFPHHPVIPGDQLMLEVSIERHARGLWKLAAQARVGDALAAEAKLLCTLRAL